MVKARKIGLEEEVLQNRPGEDIMFFGVSMELGRKIQVYCDEENMSPSEVISLALDNFFNNGGKDDQH